MLGLKIYRRTYVDACRAKINADLAAYDAHAVDTEPAFEACFFNNMTLVLHQMFSDRMAGTEGKDGNPLNEVRIICNSLLFNDGIVQIGKLPGWPESAGSRLTLPTATSVLGLEDGDTVAMSGEDFVRLSDAFFATMIEKFVP